MKTRDEVIEGQDGVIDSLIGQIDEPYEDFFQYDHRFEFDALALF